MDLLLLLVRHLFLLLGWEVWLNQCLLQLLQSSLQCGGLQ
jgi:hypothetical protein